MHSQVHLRHVMRTALCVVVLAAFQPPGYSQPKDSCFDFNQTIRTTYNFRPALLKNDAERNQKSAAMDKVWEMVKATPATLLPCLRSALEDSEADAWFRFDGSNLLVSLDPSDASKRLQIKNLTASNLDDVDLRVWVSTLAQRGVEGFDVSDAGERWLSYPKARYLIPEHGGYEVNIVTGALFIYASMDEPQATAALLKIINQAGQQYRDLALVLLTGEATPESLRFLQQLDLSTFSPAARKAIRKELDHPDLFEPRSEPKTTRKEFLDAFNALLNRNSRPFLELVVKVPDGERDVVATLTQEDLPLLRRVRRQIISAGNQHSIEYYASFTKIIKTIVLKNGSMKAN